MGSDNYDFSRKEDYERLKKNISRALRRLGVSESLEDLAQEYVCGVLEGKHRHQTIEQFVIDVLRQRSGRKGSSSYDQRLAFKQLYSLDAPGVQDSDRGVSSDGLHFRIHRDRMREFVRSPEWELYTEGHCMKEIGEMFGVTESRVSQKLKSAKTIVEKLEVIDSLAMSAEAKKWARRFL